MSGFYMSSDRPDISTNLENITSGSQIENPWQNVPLPQKVIEIIYLSIVIVGGSIGNLVVIFSITLEDRVHSHGNFFVINLAIADLIVTGFIMPSILANVIAGRSAMMMGACQATGFLVTVTCTASVANLTAIAMNRYFAVVHSNLYISAFTKKNVYIIAALCWLWSSLISLPTLIGWSRISYDVKIQVCAWDEAESYSYTAFLILLAIFVPLLIVFYCYAKLFITVKKQGKWVRSLGSRGRSQSCADQNKRSVRKETNLLKTLATSVALFSLCWLPYGSAMLINPAGISPLAKKIFGWIGLSNSAINFMIYGVINPVFRRGYRNLLFRLLKCKSQKTMNSTALHGTNSDSMYRTITRRRNRSVPTVCNKSGNSTHIFKRQDSSQNVLKPANDKEDGLPRSQPNIQSTTNASCEKVENESSFTSPAQEATTQIGQDEETATEDTIVNEQTKQETQASQ